MRKLIFLAAIILMAGSVSEAALIDRGGGLIYDTELNVTWLQDANYAYTSGYIASLGTGTNGQMTRAQAETWAASLAYYDSVRNVTLTGWRLPKTLPVNGSSYTDTGNFCNGSNDLSYNIGAPGSAYPGSKASEMAYMFYNNLGGKALVDFGCLNQADPGIQTPGPFINIQPYYWSATEYPFYANTWFVFNFQSGAQAYDNGWYYAWAVRDGDVGSASVVDLGTFNGHRYFYDTGSFYSFDAARQAAQAKPNCDLVSITSAAENDFLVNAITSMSNEAGNLRCAWIGLSRPTTADPWGWVSGEAVSYLNWRPAGVGFPWAEPTGDTAGTMYINAIGNTIPLGLWGDTYYSGSEPFNAIYETSDLLPVVVYDHFNDGVLDPAWSVGFNNATGWSYVESGSTLSVTDISPSGPEWGAVNLTRQVTSIGDFSLIFDFSWGSDSSVRAMQNILVQMYGDSGMIAAAGYSDGWIDSSGEKFAMIGGNVFNSGVGSVPLAGSARVQIIRSGSAVTVLWNGTQLISGTDSTPVTRIDLVFSYRNVGDSEGPGIFGSESVDLIEVRAFSEFDFDQDGDVDGSDLAELIGLNGTNIHQFAEVFGSVFGF
jgi:hypothetical protein